MYILLLNVTDADQMADLNFELNRGFKQWCLKHGSRLLDMYMNGELGV